MSKHLDRLEALLNRALPMPDVIDVVCRNCPPGPITYGRSGKHTARYDPDGDKSTNGLFAYRCDGCGARYSLGGKMSPTL